MPIFRLRFAISLLPTFVALSFASQALAAPGALDTTLGGSGEVRLLQGKEEVRIGDVAVQADDRIVLAGSREPGGVLLFRLLADGKPDPSFGAGGERVTSFPGGFSEARAVAIQPDGKIVIAGQAPGAKADGDFLIARFNSDGSPDPTFGGGDGATILPIGTEFEEADAVTVGADGRIAAAGRVLGAAEEVGVAVVLANGAPDPGFGGGDGVLSLKTSSGFDEGVAVELLPDKRVLLAAESGAGIGKGFSLIQLLADGSPDPGFGGGDGIAIDPVPSETQPGGRTSDMTRLPDGRIVASGYGYDDVGSPPKIESKFAVARYLANGELDPSFGEGGFFTKQVPLGGDTAETVNVGEGGKLLLGGSYDLPPAGENRAPAILRLGPGGALDPTFGAGGLVLSPQTAPSGENFQGAAVASLDRLVTVGTAFLGKETTITVVRRYLGDRLPPVLGAVNGAPHARMKAIPRKVAANKLKGFSGTASDPDGEALSVQVALVKLAPGGARASRRPPKSCFVLKNAKARFKKVRPGKGRPCPTNFLLAAGSAKWTFKLKKRLAPGRYVAYARAVDGRGLAETKFGRAEGNRYAFRVLPAVKPRR